MPIGRGAEEEGQEPTVPTGRGAKAEEPGSSIEREVGVIREGGAGDKSNEKLDDWFGMLPSGARRRLKKAGLGPGKVKAWERILEHDPGGTSLAKMVFVTEDAVDIRRLASLLEDVATVAHYLMMVVRGREARASEDAQSEIYNDAGAARTARAGRLVRSRRRKRRDEMAGPLGRRRWR